MTRYHRATHGDGVLIKSREMAKKKKEESEIGRDGDDIVTGCAAGWVSAVGPPATNSIVVRPIRRR